MFSTAMACWSLRQCLLVSWDFFKEVVMTRKYNIMKVFATVYKLTDLVDFLQLERQVDAHFKCRF